MTSPTIPPQQPEPERVCGNCEFFLHESRRRGTCNIGPHLPPFLQVDGGVMERNVYEPDTCVLFRAAAPAPVLSPEVRETILCALQLAQMCFDNRPIAATRISSAIAFVEALP